MWRIMATNPEVLGALLSHQGHGDIDPSATALYFLILGGSDHVLWSNPLLSCHITATLEDHFLSLTLVPHWESRDENSKYMSGLFCEL